MNRWQWVVFTIVMAQLAAVLVLFHRLEDDYATLGVVKYAVIASIFLASLLLPKATLDHWPLAVAITFLFVGDFFLIFLGTVPGFAPDMPLVKVGGMIGFCVAYLALMVAYNRRMSFGSRDARALLPVLAPLVPAVVLITPHLAGPMLVWALAFTTVLAFMAWSALCTRHRGYYEPRVATRFAIAGYLMFLSDLAVGFSFFYPGLHRNQPWLGTFIWVTYIPAWTLVLVNLSEPRLTTERARN